jgi:hypothetical protein
MITSKTEYDEKRCVWVCHLTTHDNVVFEAWFHAVSDPDDEDSNGFQCEELILNIDTRIPLFMFIYGEPTKEIIDNRVKEALVSLLGEVVSKENIDLNDIFDLS